MSVYRLKKQYRSKTTIAVSNGQGYKIDSDFFNRYPNAHVLIQERKEIGHYFEDKDGKPVNDSEKPVAKESKPKAKEEQKADAKPAKSNKA